MDFELTEEQVMLRDTVRDLLSRAYDSETRLKVTDTELGWSRDVWRQLAELGVLGLGFSEEDGGAGASPVETLVVLEEFGLRLAPEPLLDAVVVPGSLVSRLGTDAQRSAILPAVSGGELLLAFAHSEPGVRWPSEELATRAESAGAGYTLTGVKNPVPHGDCADRLVVSAVLPDGGLGLFLVAADAEGVTRTGYRTIDGSRGAQLEFASAPAELLGEAGADTAAAVREALGYAHAGLAAESVGAMTESLRLTAEYLRTRKQFGVTLSKFQTLTQRAANMYVSLELARSMNLYLTAAVADGVFDPVVISRVRLQVAKAARHVGQEAIQMHGGIGITAEYPVAHYVARLTAIGRTLGGEHEHLAVLREATRGYDLVEL
ncbi:acyl-CoA dehydrogenase family protein [Nocardia shimofusensis]|uniref:acyl-CoA dehydrogenase family protein n=1 Tax=Nocardia shimofusensis TaxID=228596 RepID=UPI00082C917D|nr:acyl-CoA dehydrogenase family protein [Nocardia shimofusensis]